MRKAAKQIILAAVLLAVICVICRVFLFNSFSVYVPVGAVSGRREVRADAELPEVLRPGKVEIRNGYAKIRLEPGAAGESDLQISGVGGTPFHVLRVSRHHTIYDMNTGNYTGDSVVLGAVAVFWLLVSAIMLWHFFQAKGTGFYDYGTIYYAGFSLFSLASGVTMTSVAVSHILHPETFSMLAAYSEISGASTRYMMLTAPLMLLLAGALIVSNIVLLRHERATPENVLGILASVLLVIGEGLGMLLFFRDFSGSEWQAVLDRTLQNTYATAFIYCQCMLIGSVICGIKAARNQPAPDKDYIIILGCWFRGDGTLTPLLRSRADKAISFWRMQKETTGREACIIPSGGQGKNEPMPEAEAIRRYLLEQGVPEERILPEDRSLNTYQNMCFSRELMKGTEGKAAFATSSYHVFRSGLWAKRAGLTAEGMGSRTRWWFWPNAFLRETAGLMQKRWKQEILFLLLLVAFFGMLTLVLQ